MALGHGKRKKEPGEKKKHGKERKKERIKTTDFQVSKVSK